MVKPVRLLLLAILLAGCSAVDHRQTLARQSQRLGMTAAVVRTSEFPLQTLWLASGKQKTLRVYIEGDGRAWASRSRRSPDPTPRNLLVLGLISQDSYSDKLYIARPCQFVHSENCNKRVWTDLRFSQPAITATREAIDQIKTQGGYQSLELIGFSGGGAIALLVAAGRSDVLSVRTVAGNLDPDFVNSWHKVSSMPDAISPVRFRKQLKTIPQLHFYGSDDRIIPEQVYRAYRARFEGRAKCVAGVEVKGARHGEGWKEQWPKLLAVALPVCNQQAE